MPFEEYTGDAKQITQPTTAEIKPKSNFEEYDPSKEKPGMLKEFWNTLTSESLPEIFKGGMLGNLGQGLARKANEAIDKQKPEEFRSPEAPKGYHWARPGDPGYDEKNWLSKTKLVKDTSDTSIKENLAKAKDFLKEHPGATVAEFLKGVVADPELLLPIAGEAGGAAKLDSIVARLGKLAGEGATLGAGMEAAKQFKTGEYNAADIAATATITGTLSSALGLRRGFFPKKELETGKISDETADQILDQYNDKIGKDSGYTRDDVKKQIEQELHDDKQIELNKKAHDALHSGDTKKLEKAMDAKKNPELSARINDIIKKREEIAKAFNEDPLTNHAEQMRVQEERAQKAEAIRQRRMEEDVQTKEQNQFEDEQRLRSDQENKAREMETMWADREAGQKANAESARKFDESDKLDRIEEDLRASATRAGKVGYGGRLRNQKGEIDPELLMKMGAVSGGALVAAHFADRDKLEAAIAGGLGGLALTYLPRYIDYMRSDWKNAAADTAAVGGITGGLAALDKDHPVEGAMLGALWGSTKMLPKAVIPKVGNMTIDDLINLRNGSIAARERDTANIQWAIKKAVPDAVRRQAIAEAIDKGDLSGLSESEQKAAAAYRKFTDGLGDAAVNAGVLEDMVKNYVTHIVEREGKPSSESDEILKKLFETPPQGTGTSPRSPFQKKRKFQTFEELNKALEGTGLKIKTMDLADIARIYGDSMGRAIENKKMLDNLRVARESKEGGNALIEPFDSAPSNYISINNPQMRGMLVHPDLAKPLQFVLEGKGHNDIVNGAVALALAQKRLAVGFSLFHAANLGNAYVGATGTGALTAKRSIDAAISAYRKGGAGDSVDILLRNGLRVERPMEVNQNALGEIGKLADHYLDRATGIKQHVGEKGLGAIEKIQTEVFDRVTWDYMHTGMKLAVGLREFERLRLKNPDMKPDEIAKQVASYVNDTFGGLDWYRVATESQSQIGRRIGLAALSPKGRVGLQLAMFAPDWTLSTFRAMYKALPGATKMPLTKRLHQKYVLRTAALYATLLNGINMATSGHSIWENKDPTRIEFEDGTSMQVAKHAMEGPEWLLNPRQTAMNKLGVEISLPLELALGKEWLSTSGHAPPIKSRMEHIAKKVSPISVGNLSDDNLSVEERMKRSALSTIGLPMYGMTSEQKADAAAKRAEEKRKKKEEESE